jgi:hypothetical protein
LTETKRLTLLGLVSSLAIGAWGCGEEAPLTTGLHISVTNVGWQSLGDGRWKLVGARVDVDCALQKLVVRAEHVERSSEPSASTVCSAIRRDPALLRPAAAPDCFEYYTGTVSVTGNWQDRRVNLRFPTCKGSPKTDPGGRWARLLGFRFQGPDPPA